MSGFTRDSYWYGGRLVYESLGSKWSRYHGTHCPGPQTHLPPEQRKRPECTGDWLDHALAAGFEVVPGNYPYFGLVGPGLTEGVDENALTANVLWEVVTGEPGEQDWIESVNVMDRGDMPITGCEKCGGALRCKQPRPYGWLCAACNKLAAKQARRKT